MSWFHEQRQLWIAESLRVYGFINRGHLQRKFGISEAQASKDLRDYQHAHPHDVRYNTTAKRYELAPWLNF